MVASNKLNARNLGSLTPPDGQAQADFSDGGGLVLRVTRAGSRVWLLRYRNDAGQRRGFKLGDYPAMTLSDARRARDEARLSVLKGVDPVGQRRAAREHARVEAQRPQTLDALFDAYLAAARIGRHKPRGTAKRESSLTLDRQRWRVHVAPALGRRAPGELTRGDVRAFVTGLASKGLAPATVNGVGATLRGVLSFGEFEELLDRNVARGLSTPFIIDGRERVLSRDEFVAVWRALADAERGTAPMTKATALALMLAATTAQRLGEVAGLRLDELDLDARRWTIPADRAKGKRTHTVTLSDLALALIDEARTLSAPGAWVFASRDGLGALDRRAATRAFARLVATLGLDRCTPHDLRRTAASVMTSELRTPRFVVSKVLGHAGDDGGAAAVTAVYDRHSYEPEKRAALDAWAAWISHAASGFKTANVVELAGARGAR